MLMFVTHMSTHTYTFQNSTMSGAETGVIGPREELGCFLEMDEAVEAME